MSNVQASDIYVSRLTDYGFNRGNFVFARKELAMQYHDLGVMDLNSCQGRTELGKSPVIEMLSQPKINYTRQKQCLHF